MASSSGDLVEHATSVHASHSANCVVNKECKYNVGAGRSGVDKAHYHCDLCGKATDRPQRARDHYQKKHVKGKAAGTCHHHHIAVHARANASTVTWNQNPRCCLCCACATRTLQVCAPRTPASYHTVTIV